jgi:FtsH-binding integral membrane protein
MKRTLEWILAGIGAIMCIWGADSVWISQAAPSSPPGFSLWPMPAFLLTEVALLGVVGFLGIALEPRQLFTRWGFLVWIVCGGLLGLSILGDLSVSVIALLSAPALVFGGAAILANIRRKRKMLPDLGVLVVSGIANFGLFYLISSLLRG